MGSPGSPGCESVSVPPALVLLLWDSSLSILGVGGVLNFGVPGWAPISTQISRPDFSRFESTMCLPFNVVYVFVIFVASFFRALICLFFSLTLRNDLGLVLDIVYELPVRTLN